MNFNPIPAWIEVLIGFKWRESFISWLFNPKLRLDPPMNIILFFLVSLSKLSLSFNANNKDLEALGVAGSIIAIIEIINRIEQKITNFFKNTFIIVRIENK